MVAPQASKKETQKSVDRSTVLRVERIVKRGKVLPTTFRSSGT